MNKTTPGLLAAAVAGLVIGGMTACKSTGGAAAAQPWEMGLEKHACKALNTCSGKGGCKTDLNACAGKNACAGTGGCATVAHHDCSGKNDCKAQGGCKTASHACGGQNECKTQGGCAVPVTMK